MPARIRSQRQRPMPEELVETGKRVSLDPHVEPLTVRIPMAIQLTGIGRSKLYELIGAGEIETIKIGSMRLIPMASLRALIERASARSNHAS